MAIKTRSKRVREILGDEDRKLKDLRWWKQEEAQIHRSVFATMERLGMYARMRQAQDLQYACLYDDAELAALIQGVDAIEQGIPQTMSTNICRRQTDTFVAQIVKNRPVPMAITTGGNYGEQRRAKSLTRLFEGVLDSVGYYETRELRIRDAAIFGSGLARNYRVGKKLFHKRMLPWEVRFDPLDAIKGEPRSIYFRHVLDKLVAMDRNPEHADAIRRSVARTGEDAWAVMLDQTSDVVLIEEAFHLPNSEPTEDDAKDGAWAMCVSEATLSHGEYTRDYFPLSKLDFSPGIFGWWGEGLIRQLSGLQYELNSIGLRLQEQGFMTGSYVMVADGSGVETEMIDNGALTMIRYTGQKPDWVQPPPWHPSFFDYYLKLRGQFASDITGFSGQMARGEGPPAGVTSGKAQRTFHEIASENLVPFGRRDERDCINTAWQLFDLMEEIVEEPKEKDGKLTFAIERRQDGRSEFEELEYSKVRMDRSKFRLQVFPTNFLATTPEDRWQQVSDMAEKGLFSEDEMLALLDFPDVQRVLNLRGSPRRVVEKIIEYFLDSDEPKPIKPEPTMNLDIVVALGTLAYLEAKWLDHAPEKNTAALLDFVLLAKAMRDGDLEQETPLGEVPPDAGEANGGMGPQPGSQDPMATPEEAMPALGAPGPDQLYAPPTAAPMPGNAVAPEVMPPPGAM